MYHQEMRQEKKVGKRMARGAMGCWVGLVALGIVLLVAVMACGDSGGETPTSAPTPTATQVAAPSTFSPTPSPAPVAEITYSHPHRFYVGGPEQERIMLYAGGPEQERVMLFGSITGALTYEESHVLPEGALIRIALRTSDTYGGFSNYYQPTPLETTQFPMSFVIHCDPCRVDVGWEYFADVMINGPPVGPPPPKPHFLPPPPHVGALLFVNAIKITVIDDQVLAKDIEIPVVPRPTLTGILTASEGENIPVNASGALLLWDVSQKDAEPIFVTSMGIEAGEQSPIPFLMYYHPADIDPQGTYVLEAELKRFRGRACRGVYRSKDAYEVITGGNPTHDIQLEIVQADKWVSEEVAYMSGTVTYANRDEGGEPDLNSEDGDTDTNSEDGDTDTNSNESAEDLASGTIRLSQVTPNVVLTYSPPQPNPNNPWYIRIMVGQFDSSRPTYFHGDCTLAEVEVDGSTPIPFSFSIAYHPSHIDPYSPHSDYAIWVYHRLHTGRYSGSYLKGQTLIRLNPDNPNIHAEVVVHEGRWIE